MTDDQERALVAAFLMCGEEYSYGDTVEARDQLGIDDAIGGLVEAGLVEHVHWANDMHDRVYRLTDAALEKFKGE